MPQLFVSYRHLDSIDITARLCDHLKAQFGESSVFLDYKRMSGGDDFLKVIDSAVDSSDALLAVIGPKWKGEREPNQPNRLHDQSDVVRRELERARRNEVPILPVLVGDAGYLSAGDLPDSLKKLANTHALKLRSGLDFEVDVRRIIECLKLLTGGWFTSLGFLSGSLSFPFSPPLSSPTSRSRSAVLISLRSGAVLGAIGTVYALVRTLVKANEVQSLSGLTVFGVSTLVVAAIGIVLLAISWLRLRLVALFARRRQEAALAELTSLILARLETPRLLSAASVRGLALSIEQKHQCPVITDKLIAEAVRSAAIAIEYAKRGTELEDRLELLNKLLLSIDENASSLCSIAVVDRLGAYVQSQPILAGALLLALLWAAAWPIFVGGQWSWWRLPIVAGVTGVAFLLWVSTERAIRYWQRKDDAERNLTTPLFTPGRPRLLTDLFLTASSSRARWTEILWNQVWGPFWENVMFLWRSDRQLDAMHEFRFDVAQELWSELKSTDIELEQAPNRGRIERAILEQRFRELARKLWIVTGEPQFRTIEMRGTVVREDRDTGIVGLL